MNFYLLLLQATRFGGFSSTRGIKNCRHSGLFKGCSPLQLLCNLIGKKPVIPYWPYCQTLSVTLNQKNEKNIT